MAEALLDPEAQVRGSPPALSRSGQGWRGGVGKEAGGDGGELRAQPALLPSAPMF